MLHGVGVTLDELVDQSIALIREHEPMKGYWLAFSGGKDSVVIKRLAEMAGVKFEAHYNVTTIDPPELVYFMREHHRDVKWHRPKKNFFRRMEERGTIPTRKIRWCCEEFKEMTSPEGAHLMMGIRAEESPRRSKMWEKVTYHSMTKTNAILPILDWPSEELWEFIRGEKIPYCSLYDEGFHRLGCVGCPMAGSKGRKREFARWPRFEKRWKLSFKRLWDRKHGTLNRNKEEWFGSACFDNWEQMWEWWLSDRSSPTRKTRKTKK